MMVAIVAAQAIPNCSSWATQAQPPVASERSFNRPDVSCAEYARYRRTNLSTILQNPFLTEDAKPCDLFAASGSDAR